MFDVESANKGKHKENQLLRQDDSEVFQIMNKEKYRRQLARQNALKGTLDDQGGRWKFEAIAAIAAN